jgi:hypothetical protein
MPLLFSTDLETPFHLETAAAATAAATHESTPEMLSSPPTSGSLDDFRSKMEMVNKIYNRFQDIGGCRGIHGCITADGLARMLHHLDLRGRNFLDIGMGTGRPGVGAIACGANDVIGYDFQENTAYPDVFGAALDELAIQMPDIEKIRDKAAYILKDVETVVASSLFQAIFYLWILH